MARDFAKGTKYFRAAHVWRRPDGTFSVTYDGPYERPATAKAMVTTAKKQRARYPNPNYVESFVEEGVMTWDTTAVDQIVDPNLWTP